MAQALWFASNGLVVIDLNEIVAADWRPEDDESDGPELFVWLRGDYGTALNLDEATGNELMAAIREHTGRAEGNPRRG